MPSRQQPPSKIGSRVASSRSQSGLIQVEFKSLNPHSLKNQVMSPPISVGRGDEESNDRRAARLPASRGEPQASVIARKWKSGMRGNVTIPSGLRTSSY